MQNNGNQQDGCSINITLTGFYENFDLPIVLQWLPYPHDGVDQLAAKLASEMLEIREHFDLSRVDKLVVSTDFSRSLSEVDLGYSSPHVMSFTDNDGMLAVGKAIGVLRKGMVKKVIILNADVVALLLSKDEDEQNSARGVILHELAHAEGSEFLERISPELSIQDYYGNIINNVKIGNSIILWDEYYACRRSGFLDYDRSIKEYAAFVNQTCSYAIERSEEALRSYHLSHGDPMKSLNDVAQAVVPPLKYAAYLLGYIDTKDEQQNILNFISSDVHPVFKRCFTELQLALRELWNTVDAWKTLEVFDSTGDIIERVMYHGGITFHEEDNKFFLKTAVSNCF